MFFKTGVDHTKSVLTQSAYMLSIKEEDLEALSKDTDDTL